MRTLRVSFRLGLLIALGIALPGPPATAQTTPPNQAQPPAPGLRKLTGDDAKRAEELNKAIEAALKADRWDEAIAKAQESLALRTRVQGPKHFETVTAECRLNALRRVASMPKEDRVAYRSASTMNEQATTLRDQCKYAQAQPLFEKALEIRRRLLTDDHPDTADSYNYLASNLYAQGKYTAAQTLLEKALEICRRLLNDDHPDTARCYNNLAFNLAAQGRYIEARDQWLNAVKSLDKARLRVAFNGLERTGAEQPVRLLLAAVLARLGQPAEAYQTLEEDLGRGLLDELAARQDVAPAERARLRELTAELEKLDKLVETAPKDLDKAERAKRFEDLKSQRELASIALGEFQTRLVKDHGTLAGQVARLSEIQAVVPADAALIAWIDIPRAGPNAADPYGLRWGVIVRSRGIPAWVPIAGTGPDGLWTKDDTALADRVRTELRRRPGASQPELRPLLERLRTQRLEPLTKALGATADGQPPARGLIVLPSRAMAGIPVEVLLAPDDSRTVSYAPSATVFKYLRVQPRPDRHAGLLALGDPVYERPDKSIDEAVPARSAVILTQTGLPDPLEQVLNHKPVFDGRLLVREIQRGWDLKAELVTLSACETALGREAGGEGFVGFTQALLMSGARSVCLSLWKVDDTATALLMQRFYANLLGRRPALTGPLPKAEALREAKAWLRDLRRAEVLALIAELSGGIDRSKGAKARQPAEVAAAIPPGGDNDHPYASPHFWAAFVLSGDPD